MKKLLSSVSLSALALCLILPMAHAMEVEGDIPDSTSKKRKAGDETDSPKRSKRNVVLVDFFPSEGYFPLDLMEYIITQYLTFDDKKKLSLVNSQFYHTVRQCIFELKPSFQIPRITPFWRDKWVLDSENHGKYDKHMLEFINSIGDRFPNLSSLTLKNNKEISGHILKQFSYLNTLNLIEKNIITDSALEQLNSLTSLHLRDNELITDKSLIKLNNLKALHLNTSPEDENQKITDRSLMYLTGLTELELTYTKKITDKSIMHLTNLRNLTLKHMTKITDKSLKYLTNLVELNLDDTLTITDESLKYLTNLTNLTLKHMTKITDESFIQLTNLKKLHVSLNHYAEPDPTEITDKSFMHLTGLRKLYLWGTQKITDTSLMHCINLTNMKLLFTTGISGECLKYLPNLTNLQLYGTPEIVNKYLREATSLQILNCGDDHKLTHECLQSLTNLTKLYWNHEISNFSLKSLPNLQFLNLKTTKGLTIPWLRLLTNLQHIEIDGERVEVDKVLALPNLKIVTAPDNDNTITMNIVETLIGLIQIRKNEITNLKIILAQLLEEKYKNMLSQALTKFAEDMEGEDYLESEDNPEDEVNLLQQFYNSSRNKLSLLRTQRLLNHLHGLEDEFDGKLDSSLMMHLKTDEIREIAKTLFEIYYEDNRKLEFTEMY